MNFFDLSENATDYLEKATHLKATKPARLLSEGERYEIGYNLKVAQICAILAVAEKLPTTHKGRVL